MTNYRIEAATKEEWAARALAAEVLTVIDALDPECLVNFCSQSALIGLVLRMGETARAFLATIQPQGDTK